MRQSCRFFNKGSTGTAGGSTRRLVNLLQAVIVLVVALLPECYCSFVPPPSVIGGGTRRVVSVGRWGTATATNVRRRTRIFEQRDGGGDKNNNNEKNPLEFLMQPFDSKIPRELEKEIYDAEGKTEAAKQRTQRIAGYAVVAIVGVAVAFFNAFLSELRSTEGLPPDTAPVDLESVGFGWVESNFLYRFLFMNKIGGGLALLSGIGAGFLAEADWDTRRVNAERIFEEMQRRREARSGGTAGKKRSKKGAVATQQQTRRKKKRLPGREAKRLSALAEVAVPSSASSSSSTTAAVAEGETAQQEDGSDQQPREEDQAAAEEEEDGGIMGSIKGFYQKADQMAATQALMANKKLEEAGILDKITDETGLKVIGKERAAKLQQEQQQNQEGEETRKGSP